MIIVIGVDCLTARRRYWLRWRPEPAAHANGVCQTGHASEGVPEGGAEDVGVVGLWMVVVLAEWPVDG